MPEEHIPEIHICDMQPTYQLSWLGQAGAYHQRATVSEQIQQCQQ